MATLFICNKSNAHISAPDTLLPAWGQHIAWTDQAFMDACRELCSRYELKLIRAFVPLSSGRCRPFSAHYAGLAGDFSLLAPCKSIISRQNEIRRWCIGSGLFSYVQPQYVTPLWMHMEVAVRPPASPFVPYPVLFPGDSGVHCFVLQRCLSLAAGPCLLSGRLDGDTLSALRRFRLKAGLPPTDIVDGPLWVRLFSAIDMLHI